MNVNERSVILLAKSAITGKKEELPETLDTQLVGDIFVRHHMLAMFRAGLINCQIPLQDSVLDYLSDHYCIELLNSERQLFEIAAVEQAFQENGIAYMPLKGTVMKAKYPDHAMRYMSDADILIREEQRAQLEQLMPTLGFSPLSESDHEWNWIKSGLKLELHKRLVSSDDKDYYGYLGDGWQFAKPKEGCCYEMSEEDAFVFEVVHFTKHYCKEGVSIRHLVDLWVHLYCAPHMDQVYVRQQLEKMRLAQFYDNLMDTLKAWFYDGPWNEVVEQISNVVFGNTLVDNMRQIAQSARAAQKTGTAKMGKLHALLIRVFPARKHLNWNYPQLKKVPLPFAWVVRWFILLTQREDTVKESYAQLQDVSRQQVDDYRKSLEYVGLQFPE